MGTFMDNQFWAQRKQAADVGFNAYVNKWGVWQTPRQKSKETRSGYKLRLMRIYKVILTTGPRKVTLTGSQCKFNSSVWCQSTTAAILCLYPQPLSFSQPQQHIWAVDYYIQILPIWNTLCNSLCKVFLLLNILNRFTIGYSSQHFLSIVSARWRFQCRLFISTA